MRSTTLFGIYAAVNIGLVGSLAGVTLYSLDKSRAWDVRTQLAQDSYGLHLQLEANIYRLFKQHGDALLVGDRDGGEMEEELQAAIATNIADIRTVIGREISLVGEEEIQELELLGEIEEDIDAINRAIATMTEAGDPIDSFIQIEQLAALLDGDIDTELDRKIDLALAEEREEVEEVLAEAAAFRARNERLVYGIFSVTVLLLAVGLHSFNVQIRRPMLSLGQGLARLQNAEYTSPVALGGSAEFRELGQVLNEMGQSLATREVSRKERNRLLEQTVASRTAELQQVIDKLEIGEENRKQLMADISHELRTPLAIILGEADVTLRTNPGLSDEVSDSLARIRDSARHTNQIVDDMLTVARFEAGKLRLDRRETDLRVMVQEAVAMFPGAVEVDLPGSRIMASVDPVRLRQSVLALLQNARRYGGPTIRVAIAETAAGWVITVEDDGPGLSHAEKSQAFERFFRGSNASGQGIEGNGLGLPVVRSIIEAHGGTIALQDRATGGLRVEMTLPQRPAIAVVRQDPAPKSA